MAKKQFNLAIEKLLRSAVHLNQKLTSQDRFWLMRSGFVGRTAQSEGGFILPTVTLLLLMLSLVLGLLIFRTGNRTVEIIGEKQQRQLYNAATPAVERAKVKLEYLFGDEPLPALPSESQLEKALAEEDPYTLKDETRIDLTGDGNPDNAWSFRFDASGDGFNDTVVAYSILTRSVADKDGDPETLDDKVRVEDVDDGEKADFLVVRNVPIDTTGAGSNPDCPDPGRSLYVGWEQVTGSRLRKAIQVHAFAKSLNPANRTVATLEMQQDKQANLGNKWGAWFRYDMEIFPGPQFNWNGAMYTAGNYIVGDSKDKVKFYPISNDTSCVYTKENSELAIGQFAIEDNGGEDFNTPWLGQFITGSMKKNKVEGNSKLYRLADGFPLETLQKSNDSAEDDANPADVALNPVLVLTEDVNQTRIAANNTEKRSGEDYRDPDWENRAWVQEQRLYNKPEPTPYVDDTYRADSRWGPKPVYSKIPLVAVPAGVDVSNPLQNEIYEGDLASASAADLSLIREAPAIDNAADEQSYGLDGYWERRARAQGVRVIVGQRLELGNAFGWGNKVLESDIDFGPTGLDINGDNDQDDVVTMADIENHPDPAVARERMEIAATKLLDPLYPAPAKAAGDGYMADEDREHEQRQWKSMRDNLAAAQSTAVYHYLMDDGQFPVACLASAAHPGSKDSILNSTAFDDMALPGGGSGPNVDFLTGSGTNGWEFYPPMYSKTATTKVTHALLEPAREDFADAMNTMDSAQPDAIAVALSNLAYFSGDLAGAFPPFQDTVAVNAANDDRFTDAKDSTVGPITHPYPIQTMWGDFSNLRLVVSKLEDGVAYSRLSLADRTTLQTAGCTLGMLAYNVNNIENNDLAKDTEELGKRNIVTAILDLQIDEKLIEDAGDAVIKYQEIDENGDPVTGGDVLEYRARVTDADAPFFNLNNAATSLPPEAVLKALRSNGGIDADQYKKLLAIHHKLQIQRDRTQGFSAKGYVYTTKAPQIVLGQNIPANTEIRLQCDFEGNNYLGIGDPVNASAAAGGVVGKENEFLTVALTLCPQGPKYPSLAYLFPVTDHGHDGTPADSSVTPVFKQPTTEPYTSADLEIKTAKSKPDSSTADYPFHNKYALNGNKGINYRAQNDLFRVVQEGTQGYEAIALKPKANPATDWALPTETTATGRINKIVHNGTAIWTTLLDKGFFNGRESLALRVLDVDLDLMRRNKVSSGFNKARNQAASDFWLPLPIIADPQESATRTGAAIYAFREDNRREDGIARPRVSNDNYATWLDEWRGYSREVFDADYLMNAVGDNSGDFSDPPVNPKNGISPKAVDFYADPERNPSGFRLRNGSDLRRLEGSTPVNTNARGEDELRGLSFVSDAPVYIQGDFNLHKRGNTIIEEYDTLLKLPGWDNFFSDADRGQDDLNEDFARVQDSWRASEIIADAVTVLSNAYAGTPANGSDDWFAMDGWIKQSWLNTKSGKNSDATSFQSAVRLDLNSVKDDRSNPVSWVMEDGRVDTGVSTGEFGIKISKRGFPVYCSEPDSNKSLTIDELAPPLPKIVKNCITRGGVEREYGLYDSQKVTPIDATGNNGRYLRTASETRVNAVVVSGTIPSRAKNSYGGLHNFPRFIEHWDPAALNFAGSLFQLNFSASATSPFDLDSWEPGTKAKDAEPLPYYGAPKRQWGYDVGLQYVPAAPISERFSTRDNVRSEFYQELAANDPYVLNLRCAPDPEIPGKKIDETADCD